MSPQDHNAPGAPIPPELEPELAAAVHAERQMPHGDLSALLDAVNRDVDADTGPRAWLRSRGTAMRMALAAALMFGLPIIVLLTTGRPDIGVFPPARLALDIALLALPAAFGLLVILRPLYKPQLPRRIYPALALAAVAGVLLVAGLPMAHADHPASLAGTGDDLVKRAVACFLFGSACAVPLLLWLGALMRSGRSIVLPSLVTGVVVGALGNLSVYMHCPLTSPIHLALGHATVALPFIILAAVAALRGRRG